MGAGGALWHGLPLSRLWAGQDYFLKPLRKLVPPQGVWRSRVEGSHESHMLCPGKPPSDPLPTHTKNLSTYPQKLVPF